MIKSIPSLRQANKATILRLLGDKGPLPRHVLAEMMNLTPASITKLTSELISDNFIKEVGINQGEKGKKGPKSINLDVNANKFWTIGLHIKYRIIEIACVNFQGHIDNLEILPYPSDLAQDEFLAILRKIVRDYVDRHTEKSIIAIGIGSFGVVDNEKGQIQKITHFPKWHNVPLQRELENELSIPVLVTHHIQAITLAEKRINNGLLGRNFLVVYLAEGIG